MLDWGGRIFRRIRARGFVPTLRYIRHRLSERFDELRYGIRTEGKIELGALGIADPRCKIYAPTAYRSFRAVMRRVAVQPGRDVFLDCGAGKGRVVCLAAMIPFRRVIGLEIAGELSEQAARNVERARRRFRCPDVRIITANAAEIPLPDDVTVLHFFDPFKEEVLLRVVDRIRESLERVPRRLTILYADPNHFDPLVETLPWLRRREDVPYPFFEGGEAIRNMYRIYEAQITGTR